MRVSRDEVARTRVETQFPFKRATTSQAAGGFHAPDVEKRSTRLRIVTRRAQYCHASAPRALVGSGRVDEVSAHSAANMTRSKRPYLVGTLLLATLATGQALAEKKGGAPGSARALFKEGRELAAAGRYDEACPKFEASLKLDAGMGTEFNLADCWEHVGRTEEAAALFLQVASEAQRAGMGEREQVALERANKLERGLSAAKADATAGSEPKADAAAGPPQIIPMIVESSVEAVRRKAWANVQSEYAALAELEGNIRMAEGAARTLAREDSRDPRPRRLLAELAVLEEKVRGGWREAATVVARLGRYGEPPASPPPAVGARAIPGAPSMLSQKSHP